MISFVRSLARVYMERTRAISYSASIHRNTSTVLVDDVCMNIEFSVEMESLASQRQRIKCAVDNVSFSVCEVFPLQRHVKLVLL